MLSFLAQSACRGNRPSRFSSLRAYPRPALVAKLLRERNVARFMVAPAGFGKSTLALEYAETVFAFDHVLWVDCASPCFLRDLDARGIVEGLVEVDGEPFLAVFEDVPPLDSLRAELFGAVLDDLLERGCEVLITCTPASDVFADQIDRMLIGAGDLLLSDEAFPPISPKPPRTMSRAVGVWRRLPGARRIRLPFWSSPRPRSCPPM